MDIAGQFISPPFGKCGWTTSKCHIDHFLLQGFIWKSLPRAVLIPTSLCCQGFGCKGFHLQCFLWRLFSLTSLQKIFHFRSTCNDLRIHQCSGLCDARTPPWQLPGFSDFVLLFMGGSRIGEKIRQARFISWKRCNHISPVIRGQV